MMLFLSILSFSLVSLVLLYLRNGITDKQEHVVSRQLICISQTCSSGTIHFTIHQHPSTKNPQKPSAASTCWELPVDLLVQLQVFFLARFARCSRWSRALSLWHLLQRQLRWKHHALEEPKHDKAAKCDIVFLCTDTWLINVDFCQ